MDASDPSAAQDRTAGAALFERLGALGIDYVFCNSGTDFPPIIEGLAAAQAARAEGGAKLPQTILCPHEHAALGMAHGVWFATGRPQAAILHTNVGLANGAIGAINAATDHVPLLLMSGRTPTTEKDRFGARTVPIGWGQEMRDQAALVREACKWEYELRFPEQVHEVLDRAWAVAESTPKGPVYLSLPREVLCEPAGPASAPAPLMAPAAAAPRAQDVETLADWIAGAQKPLILSQRGPGSDAAFDALAALVETWAIPVCHWWANAIAVPTTSPMEVGADPLPWLVEADLVIVLDALAPWMPDAHRPDPSARIVHIGPSPLHARTPIRNFPSRLSLPGETSETVLRLADALAARRPGPSVAPRRARVAAETARLKTAQRARAEAGGGAGPMSKAWVSRCLADAMETAGRRSTVVSELGAPLAGLPCGHRNAWRQEPHSGGLGWGLPAAMGVALAEPETLVFATMGDGSYVFSNPVACHQTIEALGLAPVILVLNNAEWGAVRQSVKGLYPDGHAARANAMPLTSLAPAPDFAAVAAASRAWARRVERGDDLPAALAEAVRTATVDKRCALLDLNVAPD
ncbi:MAG: thiamine pyrophosphate-requiring protein [Pseudomonadota bacterium]